MRHLAIGLCVLTVACSGAAPTAPGASQASFGLASADLSTGPAEPPFNMEVILRGEGFGHVKFRQEKDPTQNIYFMDVWIRDLLPNTSYSLQRAVDFVLDGVCTGTTWGTLGQGTTPHPILTDETGTGRAALWRPSQANPVPVDHHFRVIQTGTSHVVLQSDCYRLIVRD
jgi:hypothetical protein